MDSVSSQIVRSTSALVSRYPLSIFLPSIFLRLRFFCLPRLTRSASRARTPFSLQFRLRCSMLSRRSPDSVYRDSPFDVSFFSFSSFAFSSISSLIASTSDIGMYLRNTTCVCYFTSHRIIGAINLES